MVAAMTVLLVYQRVGEITVIALHLPVPGPVAGMALLIIAVTALVMRSLLGRQLKDRAP